MSPSNPGSSPGAAPLPPLPNLSGGGTGAASGATAGDPIASMMSGIAPLKASVDKILAEVQAVVKSGIIPGVENSASQVVTLVTSWLPMAIQQQMQAGSGQAAGGGPGGAGLPPVGM